jgi:hypothetical protein
MSDQDPYSIIKTMLVRDLPPQNAVEHFFYFKKESDLDRCAMKLLALGFQITSKHNRNEGLGEDVPWENDREESFNAIDYKLFLSIGKDMIGERRRTRFPWSLVVTAIHSTDEGFYEMHVALEAITLSFGGTYDGHGYMMHDDEDYDDEQND